MALPTFSRTQIFKAICAWRPLLPAGLALMALHVPAQASDGLVLELEPSDALVEQVRGAQDPTPTGAQDPTPTLSPASKWAGRPMCQPSSRVMRNCVDAVS